MKVNVFNIDGNKKQCYLINLTESRTICDKYFVNSIQLEGRNIDVSFIQCFYCM